jgi:hypothetical protein
VSAVAVLRRGTTSAGTDHNQNNKESHNGHSY